MKNGRPLSGVQFLPADGDAPFSQRESGLAHTPYSEEEAFFSLVQRGDTEGLRRSLQGFTERPIVAGRLSDDPLRQLKYWGVCCITLATRYAVQGGLEEMQAYNFSDRCIRKLDRLGPEEIPPFLGELLAELTRRVRESEHRSCPLYIRRCLDYIDRHLHEKIRLSNLAELTNFSEDYLARRFKKHVGEGFKAYVTRKKLEAAKAMLRSEGDERLIAYYLGFCSQTYFITRFKKAYGVTPHRYAESCRRGAEAQAEGTVRN